MTLGEKVKKYRLEKDMSQAALASASGITQATVSRLEQGIVQQLKSEAIARLAFALGVSIDLLLDRSNRNTPFDLLDNDIAARLLLKTYAKLSTEQKEDLVDYAVSLYHSNSIVKKPVRALPLGVDPVTYVGDGEVSDANSEVHATGGAGNDSL